MNNEMSEWNWERKNKLTPINNSIGRDTTKNLDLNIISKFLLIKLQQRNTDLKFNQKFCEMVYELEVYWKHG